MSCTHRDSSDVRIWQHSRPKREIRRGNGASGQDREVCGHPLVPTCLASVYAGPARPQPEPRSAQLLSSMMKQREGVVRKAIPQSFSGFV